MSRRKKINKLKVAIAIFALLVFFMSVTGLGRFVYNAVRDRYLSSRKFYFTSNLLTPNGNAANPHEYANWDGIGIYEIDINMFSKNNDLEKYDGELKYSVKLDYNNTDILCSLDYSDFSNTDGFYTESEVDGVVTDNRQTIPTSNEGELTVYVKPSGNKELEIGDEYTIKVTAFTSDPYKKTIEGSFKLKITDVAFTVEDEEDVSYVIMNVRNTRDYDSDITISFDPSIVRLDFNDKAYVERQSFTTDGSNNLNSITFTMPKETSKDIKFYKTDPYDKEIVTDNSYEELLEIFEIERAKNN